MQESGELEKAIAFPLPNKFDDSIIYVLSILCQSDDRITPTFAFSTDFQHLFETSHAQTQDPCRRYFR